VAITDKYILNAAGEPVPCPSAMEWSPMQVEVVLGRLSGVKRAGDGWSAQCPAHEDRRSSLSIRYENDRILLFCHAGCQFSQVIDKLGLRPSDLFGENARDHIAGASKMIARPAPKAKHAPRLYRTSAEAVAALVRRHGAYTACWPYHNAAGAEVGLVLRWDVDGSKDIRPISLHQGSWIVGGMAVPRPLYRLTEVLPAKEVYVVEGEKAADAGRSIGLVCTTSAHGAKSADKTDWSPLAGKRVLILPDNDTAGLDYAEWVLAKLLSLQPAPRAQLIQLPGLPPKGDLADFVALRLHPPPSPAPGS
jgi:putative DNA primase/helicase